MSADTVYSVEVRYFSTGNLDAGAKSASDTWLKSMTSGASKVASSFNNAFDSVASSLVTGVTAAAMTAGAAVGAIVGKSVKEGLSFNTYTEDLTNGIASTMAMLGGIPIDQGIKQAINSTENLRKLALRLPGEFKDAANAFSYILPVGLEHGVAMPRLEKMAGMGVAAAASLGINQNVAGHELAALLEGRASSRMPLFAKMGLGDAKAFNKLSFDKRFEKIDSKYDKLGGAMDLYSGSWSGMTSAAKDQGRNLAKTLAQPLFGSIKGELERGLSWFGKNEDAAHAWAMRVGVGIDHAFHVGLDAARHWIPLAVHFGQTLYDGVHRALDPVMPLLKRLGNGAESFLGDPKALDKLGHVAGSMLALRAGSGALSLGISGAQGIGSMLGGAGVGAEALAAAAPFAAAGVAMFALAAEGASHALLDSSSLHHDAAVQTAASIGGNATMVGDELLKLNEQTRNTRDGIGVLSMMLVDRFTREFGETLQIVNAVTAGMNYLNDGLVSAGTTLAQYFGAARLKPTAAELHVGSVENANDTFASTYSPVKAMAMFGDSEVGERIKPPKQEIHNHNTIKIDIEANMDPNRVIATEIGKHLEKIQRQNNSSPLQSR